MNKRRRLMSAGDSYYFPEGTSLIFYYTGSVQKANLPPGLYYLQVWGAEGGTSEANSDYDIVELPGGKGGYSLGMLDLTENTTINIYVGGSGDNGGYNGGGRLKNGDNGPHTLNLNYVKTEHLSGGGGTTYSNTYCYVKSGGGGGATDMRLIEETSSNATASLKSRFLVAGGGSGGAMGAYRYVESWSGNPTKIITGTTTCGVYPINHSGDGVMHSFDITNYVTLNSDYYFTIDSNHGTVKSQGIYYYYTSGDFLRSNYNGSGFGTNSSWECREYELNGQNSSKIVIAFETSSSDTGPYTVSLYRKGNREYNETTAYCEGYAAGSYEGFGYLFGNNNYGGQTTGTFTYQSLSWHPNYNAGGSGGGWGAGTFNDSINANCDPDFVQRTGSGCGYVSTISSYKPTDYTGLTLLGGYCFDGLVRIVDENDNEETGHSGNGVAKITRVSAGECIFIFKDNNNIPIEGLEIVLQLNTVDYIYAITDSNGQININLPLNETFDIVLPNNEYTLDINLITVSSRSNTFNIIGTERSLFEFSYSTQVNTISLNAGTYKLECWGAQGGSLTSTYAGGKGGYSVGELTLSSKTTIYIHTGGSGEGGTSSGSKSGGYNGGGNSYSSNTAYANGGGGGASDIRIGTDSLYARVIVAGGGGGAGCYNSSNKYAGGYGGGTIGGTPSRYNTSYKSGEGGSLTAKGNSYYGSMSNSPTYGYLADFGNGGSCKNTSYDITGGGGGWYGGGYSRRGAGGGGSGYVYTLYTASNYPSGCLLNSSYYLTNASTSAGNTSFTSPTDGSETGHEGNGYVRITKLS